MSQQFLARAGYYVILVINFGDEILSDRMTTSLAPSILANERKLVDINQATTSIESTRCMICKKHYLRNDFQTSLYSIRINKRRPISKEIFKKPFYDFFPEFYPF